MQHSSLEAWFSHAAQHQTVHLTKTIKHSMAVVSQTGLPPLCTVLTCAVITFNVSYLTYTVSVICNLQCQPYSILPA